MVHFVTWSNFIHFEAFSLSLLIPNLSNKLIQVFAVFPAPVQGILEPGALCLRAPLRTLEPLCVAWTSLNCPKHFPFVLVHLYVFWGCYSHLQSLPIQSAPRNTIRMSPPFQLWLVPKSQPSCAPGREALLAPPLVFKIHLWASAKPPRRALGKLQKVLPSLAREAKLGSRS